MVHHTFCTTPRFHARLQDLSRLLADLVALHRDLVDVLQRKLLAMRQSDVDGMQSCVMSESVIAQKIQQREGLRRQLVVLIGQDMGIGEAESKTMPIRQLAAQLDEKKRVQLRALAVQLAQLIHEIAKVNAVIGRFGDEMLRHYRIVFGEITSCMTESTVYSPADKPRAKKAQVMDAMG